MPDPLTQARNHLAGLAADRQRRGTPIPPEHIEAAAKLLVDLWAVATRHSITPNHPAWTFHLPRAALDTISAAHRSRSRTGRPPA
jgi:hypothetical protein